MERSSQSSRFVAFQGLGRRLSDETTEAVQNELEMPSSQRAADKEGGAAEDTQEGEPLEERIVRVDSSEETTMALRTS